jgi:hypothetical protein
MATLRDCVAVTLAELPIVITIPKNQISLLHFIQESKKRRMAVTGKIFYRQRRKIKDGEKKPRFRIVGVFECNLKIYTDHLRMSELEHISEEAGVELVNLRHGFAENKPKKAKK